MKKVNCFRVVIWLGLFIFSFASSAVCAPYTLHRFISTALSDSSVASFREIKNFTKQTPGNTPYIERIELRAGVESSDDDNQQDYRLRFYPRPWGGTKHNRQLYTLLHKAYQIEQNRFLGRALKHRYTLVLKYIWCDQHLKLKRSLEKIYNDRSFVLQKKLATRTGADVGALITAENKRIDLQLEINALENQMAGITRAIKELADTTDKITFKNEHLISMAQIKKVVEGQKTPTAAQNIKIMRQKNEVALANCEFALEKAQTNDYFRYFEVGHSRDDQEEESISFQIGIRLPFIGTARKAIWDRQFDVTREKSNYDRIKAAVLERMAQAQRRLNFLLSQHNMLKKGRKRGNAFDAVRSHIASTGADALDLLKLNESILQRDIQLNDTALEIRSEFIEYMDLTGRLIEKPLINYLSNYLIELL